MSSVTSPVQTRDIRSAAQAFKRDRDSASKWAYGSRPHHGHNKSSLDSLESSDVLDVKVRPGAQPYVSASPSLAKQQAVSHIVDLY